MQSAKETAANVSASAKSGLEKTKATVQEKAEKMTTRDPLQKEMATEKKEAKIHEAERQKHEVREAAKAGRTTGHGYPAGGGTTGYSTGTGTHDATGHTAGGTTATGYTDIARTDYPSGTTTQGVVGSQYPPGTNTVGGGRVGGKSGRNWLDRLRSSRGFPSGDASNLENFLNNPTSPDLEQPDPIPDHNLQPNPSQNNRGFDRVEKEDKQLFDVMTNVLFELFNYGDSNNGNFPKMKKTCRKQSNPRIYIPSNNDINENINVHSEKESRSDDDSSQVAGVKESSENLVLRRNEEEGDTSKGNLLGYSLTEVTVIDTSYKSWKFEKLLYRKKNVWKVRDKKGASVNVGSKKKRKQSASFLIGEKKQKVVDKEVSGRECDFSLNDVSYETNKSAEDHEKALDTASKIVKKKEANLKSEKGSMPVILIKSIPPSKKHGTSITKNCIKSKQNKP